MDKTKRVFVQLFYQEVKSLHLVERDALDLELINTEAYRVWYAGKGTLGRADVVDTHWVKTCAEGYVTEVVFHADGTLNEYRLFDRFATAGTWSLDNGLLNLIIRKGENTYTSCVVGNGQINIHSAIEYKNGLLHAYLKLIQVK